MTRFPSGHPDDEVARDRITNWPQCSECGTAFKYQDELKKHQDTAHGIASPPKTSTVDTLAKILSQNFYYKLDSEGGKVVCLNQKRAMQQLNQLLYDARISENEQLIRNSKGQEEITIYKFQIDNRIKELKALKGESTQ